MPPPRTDDLVIERIEGRLFFAGPYDYAMTIRYVGGRALHVVEPSRAAASAAEMRRMLAIVEAAERKGEP